MTLVSVEFSVSLSKRGQPEFFALASWRAELALVELLEMSNGSVE